MATEAWTGQGLYELYRACGRERHWYFEVWDALSPDNQRIWCDLARRINEDAATD